MGVPGAGPERSTIFDLPRTGPIWVFGYGSLVHSPSFEHSARVNGYIRGYRRVFWQGSTDHRGTPERPGRTVTLVVDSQAMTWGTAFRLAGTEEQQRNTLSYLEWREKQYDVRARVDVLSLDDSGAECVAVPQALTYIASADTTRNVNYLGPAALEEIAIQVANSEGPSGHNSAYVFRLADAMRGMGVHDEELFWLEERVRQIMAAAAQDQPGGADGAGGVELPGASGDDKHQDSAPGASGEHRAAAACTEVAAQAVVHLHAHAGAQRAPS